MNPFKFRKQMMGAATLALSTALLCSMPLVAQDNSAPPPPAAQDNAGPPPQGRRGGGERDLKRMTKELNLSSDQVSQIKAFNEDSRKQMMALRDDSSLSQDDRRSKMMDIRKASQDKIRGVLNDDQKTKYDAMLADRRGHRRDGNGEAPPPPPPPPPPQ
ncbi:hypothetical protein GCM10011507_14840 [Edaphobacter acidisoli]|uniref:Spy/CpxP family protein refolding chaperone n=1 Tax=Edaphobacter acidisoli TaxID=2040573 RepID=A0A916RPS1_9BACT|nr:hypothetical protein [Edaphobacter acidisoli]GGA64259.1 hypothetical protein GCM10011507_14840 [Edaphobacter acidisoli]